VLHQLLEHQELEPGERQRAAADVRLHPAGVQPEIPDPHHPVEGAAAQLVTHPGDQFGERERLGQVVARTEFEAVHLGPDVGEARQHKNHLPRLVAKQLPQHGPAVQARHQQVEDDQAVGPGERLPKPFRAGLSQVDRQAFCRKRPTEAGANRLFVVDKQDTRAGNGAVVIVRAARCLSGDHDAPAQAAQP
jgi:hypothetical protein